MTDYLIKTTTFISNSQKKRPYWQNIPSLELNHFPWYKHGLKQQTYVKLCSDNDSIFIQFIAQDKYSFAKQVQLNHMQICEDSCVEFFFSPSGILGSAYINLEINCCGILHIAYGSNRHERKFIDKELANKILCETSIKSETKTESEQDDEWTVDVTLPFNVLEQLTLAPINRQHWYGNFYRCGGRKDPQFSSWSPVPTPQPDFHCPEFFGKLTFEKQSY